MSNAVQETLKWPSSDEVPEAIDLSLTVGDRDTIRALVQHAEGTDRNEYALEALKIGVAALRHAAGAWDTDFITRETTRMVESLRQQLDEHSRQAQEKLTGSFKDYLDPESGKLSQRLRQLTANDGELARFLRPLFDGDDSALAKTLVSHIGENSPLMRQLSPDQSKGLLALLRTNVETQLTQQREHLLKEFSLDNPEGSLRRLVSEITDKHGDFTKHMQVKIDEVVKEFSLDEENSALSRLVGNVDSAQKKITQEFSLDNKQSALHKLKEELTTILSAHVKTNAEFQEEVKLALEKLVTKREEAARSTRHGLTFEHAVYEFVAHQAHRRGDLPESTGERPGLIKNCKVGDAIVELGPENSAAGAKIVIEAKQKSGYTLNEARTEIEQARKNRDAQIGLFVFSRRLAPTDLEPLTRHGNDLFLVWDAEDTTSDPFFRAALEIARALCVRTQHETEQRQVDFTPIDRSVLDIEKRVKNLDQIRSSAQTIKSSSEKILDRLRIDQEALEKQVVVLRESMTDLKQAIGSDKPTPSSLDQ
ncbi:MAG: hypothetical protein AAGD11_04070 [Planctomycetota bacterium]